MCDYGIILVNIRALVHVTVKHSSLEMHVRESIHTVDLMIFYCHFEYQERVFAMVLK